MNISDTIAAGKYLASPLARQQSQGRVLRFHDLFNAAGAAVHYATEHVLGWIQERAAPICA